MTQKPTGTHPYRRDILKSSALLGAAGVFGTSGSVLMSIPASAATAATTEEVLYLVDNSDPFGGAPSVLYSVDLVDGTDPVASLTSVGPLTDTTENITYVSSHIACTPDGSTVYAVNEGAAFGPGIRLGAWDVDSGTFSDIGPISGVDSTARLTQAAISPDGKLYLIDVVNDKLYEIQDYATNPSAAPALDVTGTDLQGGDLVFDYQGTLYSYSLSPEQLLVIDPTTGDITEKIGADLQSFTGLAIRDAGEGLLVGSRNKSSNPNPNSVIELDPADGSVQTVYAMKLDGSDFAHTFGDMSVGPLAPDCVPCDLEEPIKYEYVFEEDGDDADSEPDVDGFIPEDAPDAFGYSGYVTKMEDGEPELYEPMTVCFGNPGNYCLDSLAITVKAGRDLADFAVTESDDGFCVAVDGKYAISYIEFACADAE